MSIHSFVKIAVFFAVYFGINNAAGQALVTRPKIETKHYAKELTIIAGPQYGTIRNANISADKYASTAGTITANFGINYMLPFSKNIGYCMGLEYNQVKNITQYKGFFKSTKTQVDKSGYIYYPVVNANYVNTLVLTTIDIPLTLRVRFTVAKNLELFADAGLKLNAVLSYKLIQDGTSEKEGLYPLKNVNNQYLLYQNDPYYGYITTTYNKESKPIEIAKVVFSGLFSVGLNATTSEKTFLTFNAVCMPGISDLNADTETTYVNVLGESTAHKKYTALQFGLRIGVGFRIY